MIHFNCNQNNYNMSTMKMMFRLALSLFLLFRPSDASVATTFTLYDNGSSKDGVNVTLSSSHYAEMMTNVEDIESEGEAAAVFAGIMSTKIKVSKYMAEEPVIANRAYREDGEMITTFDQLLPFLSEDDSISTRRVYLVAEDLDFVWPFIEVHHRQVISPNVIQSPEPNKNVVIESMSDIPRVFRILHMFTLDEAAAIIDVALTKKGRDSLKRSTTGTNKEGKGQEDIGRTSHNAWDHQSQGAKDMIRRSFQLTNVPDDDGKRDGLQVVRYTQGQGYNTHPDFFSSNAAGGDFNFNPYSGGSNRFATVFMYLNDVEEGGFTVFPKAPGIVPPRDPPKGSLDLFGRTSWERGLLKQCYTKLAVPAKAATAALFYSATPDGRMESNSLHAACPLTSGIKWGANIWIWNKHRYGDIRTGEAESVTFINRSPTETVYLKREGKNNGSIPPGKSMTLGSFEHHRFKASYGSYQGEAISYFTVGKHNTEWEIKEPHRYDHRENERKKMIEKIRNLKNRKKLARKQNNNVESELDNNIEPDEKSEHDDNIKSVQKSNFPNARRRLSKGLRGKHGSTIGKSIAGLAILILAYFIVVRFSVQMNHLKET